MWIPLIEELKDHTNGGRNCGIIEVNSTHHEGIDYYKTLCNQEFDSDKGNEFLYCPYCGLKVKYFYESTSRR